MTRHAREIFANKIFGVLEHNESAARSLQDVLRNGLQLAGTAGGGSVDQTPRRLAFER